MSSLWPSGMIRVYRHEGSGARKEKAWAASWTYGRSGPVSPFGLDMTYVWKGRKQPTVRDRGCAGWVAAGTRTSRDSSSASASSDVYLGTAARTSSGGTESIGGEILRNGEVPGNMRWSDSLVQRHSLTEGPVDSPG